MSSELTNVGLSALTGATAALITSSPVGPAGGAVFGVTYGLLRRPIEWLCVSAFNSDQENASLISKIISIVASGIIGCWATAGIMTAVGFPVTMGGVAILALAAIPATLLIVLLAKLILESSDVQRQRNF